MKEHITTFLIKAVIFTVKFQNLMDNTAFRAIIKLTNARLKMKTPLSSILSFHRYFHESLLKNGLLLSVSTKALSLQVNG